MAGIVSRFVSRAKQALYPVDNRGAGWLALFPQFLREAHPGDWQRNIEYRNDELLAFYAVFACITRISQDISKLCFCLRQYDDAADIYKSTSNPAFSPVLARPNDFQNHIQFKESWLLSKLYRGNAYILKERDARNVVVALYVLHPDRVQPLITPSGDVYYRLQGDFLSQIGETGITIPASEIIHDRMNTIFHPLVGVSPLFASAMAAAGGLEIQKNSAHFFANNSVPNGVLVVPGEMSQDDAKTTVDKWNANYGGKNTGKAALLTGGMTYQQLRMTATDSQLIEQLKMTGQTVCSVFHVPPYKVGIGDMPAHQTVEALAIQYTEECLQFHIECMEACLDDALAIGDANNSKYDVCLDTDGLARMDSSTQATAESELVKSGIKSPNESRKRFNLGPVKGGETPLMQQQMYSLAALSKRDAAPPSPPAPILPPPPPAEPSNDAANDGDVAAAFVLEITKGLAAA